MNIHLVIECLENDTAPPHVFTNEQEARDMFKKLCLDAGTDIEGHEDTVIAVKSEDGDYRVSLFLNIAV